MSRTISTVGRELLKPWHAPGRGSVQLRRPPGTRIPRWPPTQRIALLHQFRGTGFRAQRIDH